MNLEGKKVIIDAEIFLQLLEKYDELIALECVGVDNWGLYGEHMEYMRSEEDRLDEVYAHMVSK